MTPRRTWLEFQIGQRCGNYKARWGGERATCLPFMFLFEKHRLLQTILMSLAQYTKGQHQKDGNYVYSKYVLCAPKLYINYLPQLTLVWMASDSSPLPPPVTIATLWNDKSEGKAFFQTDPQSLIMCHAENDVTQRHSELCASLEGRDSKELISAYHPKYNMHHPNLLWDSKYCLTVITEMGEGLYRLSA